MKRRNIGGKGGNSAPPRLLRFSTTMVDTVDVGHEGRRDEGKRERAACRGCVHWHLLPVETGAQIYGSTHVGDTDARENSMKRRNIGGKGGNSTRPDY